MHRQTQAHSKQHPFERTLIVGASVSAAPVDRNPVKRFLRTQGVLGGAVSHAMNGTPGAQVLSSLKKSVLSQVTAVIALDLMFWDSVIGLGDPAESKAFLRGFFKEVAACRIPIVIGRVPGFHALQIHREELNEAIERECRAYGHSRQVELDALFARVTRDGGIEVDGRLHHFRELVPDGLHPGPVASEYLAGQIELAAQDLLGLSRQFQSL